MRFHRRCGDRVTLLNENSTAVRNFVEFNHGLILSSDPLTDDIIFEVYIDRKVNVWNGSLEIGVTTLDPEFMELPATATKLRNTAWILSGSSIVKDGVTVLNSYGPELDTLQEGDSVGVMRSSTGELMFYINGQCLGVAATDMPDKLFAIIDLYGQCVQVSIRRTSEMRAIAEPTLDQIGNPNNDDTLTSEEMDVAGLPSEPVPKETTTVFVPMTTEGACALVAQDRLRFHPRCGILVKLSANNKSAERARPLDDYNNGVVMTHRPLYDNELFEIRIDRLVDKWSGSIEVGVTTHNPATIRFPSTMTNLDSGTVMMSGCKVLLNGHGTCTEYGNFNLDELREGDTVGIVRKANGQLHYYINGIDQGVATDRVEQQVWGVVDLYGMTVKVTIVDPLEEFDNNVNTVPHSMEDSSDLSVTSRYRPAIDEDSLLFHTLRDSNIIIINDGKTAHRPNAFEYFNNGIVMTNRTLKTNELFQVRLDLVIPKWAGSVEIGVTQHSLNDIQLPFKMSNAKSGTWAITGEDVINDGTIVIPQYVRNLNRLTEGDTVGVMRKDMGILHFFVNGVDQGPAAFDVPEQIFGVIDLYGRVAQATIVDAYLPPPAYSPDSPLSTESNATIFPEMCFHRVHGRNARLSSNRLTARRATVYSEFNDAVLFSSRPLRECDMFEIRIDKMVDCWIGSIEIGVTAIRPEDLEDNGGVGAIAGTATDLNWDTYILSGAAMMKDGECVRSGYPLDLDSLTVGSRVGMMWHADRSLHYYLDGLDMGKAWYVPHLNIYAVVDLYGQCTQVTILRNEERTFNYNAYSNSDNSILSYSRAWASPPPPYWSFSEYCGDNVRLMHEHTTAYRITSDPTGALVFSSAHLAVGEIFEIKVAECKYGYAGGLRMGVTDINILNVHVNRSLPSSIAYLPHFTAYVDGKYMKYSIPGTRNHEMFSFVPSLEWLRPGDRVGLKKVSDGRVVIYYNSEPTDLAFENVPDKVYVVIEIYGHVTKIQVVTKGNVGTTFNQIRISSEECLKLLSVLPTALLDNSVEEEQNGTDSTPVDNEVIDDQEIANSPTAKQVIEEVKSDYIDDAMVLVKEIHVEGEAAAENPILPMMENVPSEILHHRNPLPYTFHYVHGKNIKLCSSDTVAMRTAGYNEAVAIVSQPLRRGHTFRFRVDKISREWSGTASIGAIAFLPNEMSPLSMMHYRTPTWFLFENMIIDNGYYMMSDFGKPLNDLEEKSVLSLHFRFNSDLVLEIDGKVLGAIAMIPRNLSHVFPTINLYGKVCQVSILLHPYIITGGLSLDLPMITENLREESLAELEISQSKTVNDASQSNPQTRPKNKVKAYSQDNLIRGDALEPIVVEAGPSSMPDQESSFLRSSPDSELVNIKIITKCRKIHPHGTALYHSMIFWNTTEMASCCLQKSHSTHSFCQIVDENEEVKDTLRHTYSVGSRVGDDRANVHDTNIQHNEHYPEAIEVDNLDIEIMDGLTLETGNLPDLTEEQSSSIDESTRRDDIWADSLSVENLNYLNRILCLDHESVEGHSLEAEWDASGENCEHLRLVLKYWNFLVLPYPELRCAVSWGQVRCYCTNCQPNAEPPFAGWIRIERIDGVGAARRAFWHVVRSTLGSAQATGNENGPVRRPRSLAPTPSVALPRYDIWFDEEGKPHHVVLAIEIDVE